MKSILRYLVLMFFLLYGLYMMSWAIQSASFSIPEVGIIAEFHKTKATILFPLSITLIAQGFILFILMKRK